MTDAIQPYRERCKCGHDKASHFAENGKRLTCLVFGDCECKRYVNEYAVDPPPTPRVAARDPFFAWPKAVRFDDDDFSDLIDDDPPPSTDPWPWSP